MNTKTQKILARETIIFFISLLLLSLVYLYIIGYNSYKQSKCNTLSVTIAEKHFQRDSLQSTYANKLKTQEEYFNKLDHFYDMNTTEILWKRLRQIYESDSIEYKWANSWDIDLINFNKSIGLGNAASLSAFIEDNLLNDSEIRNRQKVKLLQKEIGQLKFAKIKTKNTIVSDAYRNSILKYSILIIIIFLFLVRYAFYALRWSIITMRKSD